VRVKIDDVTVATLGFPWLGVGVSIERALRDSNFSALTP